ncbi:cation diffusion facilitator family transporter [Campylobacter sp. 19-13652]|uniref:cation diffusion facilitator family transporter n=1 Tax=Campylobacter sp. 19-13652 TaxID=2840180 RepID=UPI001C793882|nr:cation diffusion facilitator family transporter [Campylobacter sp. 19-13652]BCX79457.1 cation transporter [Campylobacter sp. 19-13652]
MSVSADKKQAHFRLKKLAIISASATSVLLAVIKFIAGIASGSISVLSSAIDSMLDCLISVLNFFALKKSSDAPNARFNYGFGKIEALSSLFEGTFIIGVGIFIFYESVLKIVHGKEAVSVDIGLYIMLASMLITGALIAFLSHVAKLTNDLIIRTDALHYKSDLYTNAAIVIALIIIKFTGFWLIDPLLGIAASAYIIYSAIKLVKEGIFILLDAAISESEQQKIVQIILSFKQVLSFHYFKSRKSANTVFLSYHLVFQEGIALAKAHQISDQIIAQIKASFPDSEWIITPEFDPVDDSDEDIKEELRCIIKEQE